MPRIRYIGPFAQGVHSDQLGVVLHSQVIDVDDETHASLAAQADWEATTDPVSVLDDEGRIVDTKKSRKPEPTPNEGDTTP